MSTDTPAQPLQKLASWQKAKYFWDKPFHKEEFVKVIEGNEEKWEIRLSNHREKAIRNSGSFLENNNLPSSLSSYLKASIFAHYQAYRQMLLWFKHYDQKGGINLLEEGDLYGPNYFTVDGKFNDVAWAKCFVNNPNYDIDYRFEMACFYCLENETASLWIEERKLQKAYYTLAERFCTRENMMVLETEILSNRKLCWVYLVLHRAIQLKSALCAGEQIYDGDFFLLGLKISLSLGFEHALYYFWQNSSEMDKEFCIGGVVLYNMMNAYVDYPVDKVIHYFYSQMSRAQKEKLLAWTIQEFKTNVWLTLLLSPCAVTRCEVLELVYKLPIGMYINILKSMIDRICSQKLPFDMDMFKVLWKELSPEQMNSVLEEPSLIQKLTDRKVYYIIGYIMRKLSLEQKAYFIFVKELCLSR